ncbi:hypothetical protein L6164_009573 [Bauhinia variegata]|uniref:Uncharacterized protein n=1 Tax=Bauhinia variegata TaxID=167791 RepID=A0ACB9PLS7_BAUVA|nr:hypothetical protein L6164_009573 [Bauhinia variegata]
MSSVWFAVSDVIKRRLLFPFWSKSDTGSLVLCAVHILNRNRSLLGCASTWATTLPNSLGQPRGGQRFFFRNPSFSQNLTNTLVVGHPPHSGKRFEHWVPLNLSTVELRLSFGFIGYKTTEFPRILILLLGYAYPGFECYKTVEKNRVEIEELRFWCQYWIIVAIITVLERFADIFISWLPLYGEMKLVLFICLWHPKTKGTGYLYGTVLRPIVARHENEIDRKILECKARAWDLVICYGQNFAQLGHTAFFQALQYMITQSSRFSGNVITKKNEPQDQNGPQWFSKQPSLSENKQNTLSMKNRKWPPSPPSSPITRIDRNISGSPRVQTVRLHLDSRTEFLKQAEATVPEPINKHDSSNPPQTQPQVQDDHSNEKLHNGRPRLRRLNTATHQ